MNTDKMTLRNESNRPGSTETSVAEVKECRLVHFTTDPGPDTMPPRRKAVRAKPKKMRAKQERRLPYIEDRQLMKAVLFAKNMIQNGTPGFKAVTVAARYYKRPVGEVGRLARMKRRMPPMKMTNGSTRLPHQEGSRP